MQLIILYVALLATASNPAATPLPWLGLSFTWIESRADQHVLHVRAVSPGGPAATAGIRPGDLVTAVNGARVDFGDELEFLLCLQQRKPAERLRLSLVREGRPIAAVVILGTLPPESRAKWERNLRMARERRASSERARRQHH